MAKSAWSEESVGGHPCDVFEPAERNPNGYVVVYLHGVHLTRLRDKPRFTELLNRNGLCAVSPVTQRSWWTDRICSEFDVQMTAQQHVMRNVLPFVAERFSTEPPKIALLGTSMGGQGALRLSYRFPDEFPVVAAISPAIDFHKRIESIADETDPLLEMFEDAEAARQETAILHVHPLNWPRHQFFCCDPTDHRWYDGADRLRMKLSSLGVPHECELETVAGGHGFEYYDHMAARVFDFIVSSLNSERLRVI